MSQFPAQYVVYAYLYIGVGLLLFNLAYTNSRTGRQKLHERRVEKWKTFIQEQLTQDQQESHTDRSEYIKKKLRRIRQFLALHEALEFQEAQEPEKVSEWLQENLQVFRDTAFYYLERNSMERAYSAWFLARFRLIRPDDSALLSVLTEYLNDSTIYCRENVLKAVYCSGSIESVVNVFHHFNDEEYYHNRKLLSDGLATFTGDREQLAHALWEHRNEWNAELVVAVVQFITRMRSGTEDFHESFLRTLEDTRMDSEVRLAVLRYFAAHYYEPAHKTLCRYAEENEQITLAIVSVTALSNYPSDESIAVLQNAVCSRNWYVRTNAAESLIKLTRNRPDREQLLRCEDQYGSESIAYRLKLEQTAMQAGKS